MSGKRLAIRAVGIVAATCGLLVAVIAPAGAATSNQILYHADRNVAGEVWFNSGNHAAHAGHPQHGFNSFTIKDSFCNDSWAIGIQWRINNQLFTHQGAGDCDPIEETAFQTGQATAVITQFEWRSYRWNVTGQYDTEYGAWQRDWMGSDSVDGNSRWFDRTSVYNDKLTETSHTFTASMWPTTAARAIGPGATWEMWAEFVRRTPLPASLTEDQRMSVVKQFACHVLYARIPELGGPTWDLEASRPNIPWSLVWAGTGKCNW